MKKLLYISIFLFPAFFFSCASSSSIDSENSENTEIEIPEIENSENSNDIIDNLILEPENSENLENDSESEVEEETVTEVITEEVIEEDESDLEIPEDFEEPEIFDLTSDFDFEEPYEDFDEEENEISIELIPEQITDPEDLNPPEFDSSIDENQDELNQDFLQENEELFDEEDEESFEDEDLNSQDEMESGSEEQEIPEEIVIVPSRSVSLKKGENLEILYPGSGWVYMGSLSEYNNMASKGRKIGATDTKYTLLAKEPGTQIHHFYKVDNITGEYIDDYLEVTVLEKKGNSKTTVIAPEYVEVVPKKPELPAEASSEIVEIVKTENLESEVKSDVAEPATQKTSIKAETKKEEIIEIVEDAVEEISDFSVIDEIDIENDIIIVDDDYSTNNDLLNINTDELLDNAIILYNEGSYSEANILLVEFFEYAFDRIDEALFLQGQILEEESEIKDIKGAIQSYEALLKNYPSSTYWNDANKRIKYLRKFYYISN